MIGTPSEICKEIKKRHGKENLLLVEVWCKDDVSQCAKDNGVKLSKDDIASVLYAIDHNHDASLGINWDTIWYGGICNILEERKTK